MLAQLPNGDWLEADIVYGVSVMEDPANGWIVRAYDDCFTNHADEFFGDEKSARDYALQVAVSINASKTREPDIEAIVRDAVKAAADAFLNSPITLPIQQGDWRHAV